MNREEQIKFHAGSTRDGLIANYVPTEQAIMYEDGFVDGAKWADENPKEGLVSIDKVYEYLNKNIFQSYTYNAGNKIGNLIVNNKFTNKEDFLKAFRETMEE